MTNKTFSLAILFLLLLLNLFPIYQGITNRGILFYQNAFDEPSYLNYEVAQQSLTRMRFNQVGGYLILLGHQAGLSAGWINFILDTVVPLGLLLLLRAIFVEAKMSAERANLSALLLVILPALYQNIPYLSGKFYQIYLNTRLVEWVVTPQIANWLALMRTPDPQVSYLLLAGGVYLAQKTKALLAAFLCLPFLYPYLAVPVFFILTAVFLHQKLAFARKYVLLPLLAAFGCTAAGLFVFYQYYSDGEVRGLMAATHLPFFSVTGAVCLLILIVFYRRIPERYRFPCLALSLAPWAVANQQIFTGWISQPVNYESYFGLYAIAFLILIVINLYPLRWGKILTEAALLALVYLQFTPLYGDYQFTRNYLLTRNLHWSADAWAALKNTPERVAIDNLDLAASAGTAFPKQRLTALAYQKSSVLFDEKANQLAYQCLKMKIQADPDYSNRFGPVFSTLDRAYVTQARDFIFVHHKRVKVFTENNLTPVSPEECPPGNYLILTQAGGETWLP